MKSRAPTSASIRWWTQGGALLVPGPIAPLSQLARQGQRDTNDNAFLKSVLPECRPILAVDTLPMPPPVEGSVVPTVVTFDPMAPHSSFNVTTDQR